MQKNPVSIVVVTVRKNIVLPLLTIQQYTLFKIQGRQKDENTNFELLKVYQKMVTQFLFGIMNASRNST